MLSPGGTGLSLIGSGACEVATQFCQVLPSAATSYAGAGMVSATLPPVSVNLAELANVAPPSCEAQMVPWCQFGLLQCPPDRVQRSSVTGSITVRPPGSARSETRFITKL